MAVERYDPQEEKKYRNIVAGLALPSKKPGFICVIGETKDLFYQNKRRFVQLDDFETWDGPALVEKASWLIFKYRLDAIFGDRNDPQLDALCRSTNDAIYEDKSGVRKELGVTFARILAGRDDANPYRTVMSRLNVLLGGIDRDPDKQRLFIQAGKLKTYLQAPSQEESFGMKFGDFPSIDSLVFAVEGLIKMEKERDRPQVQEVADMDYDSIY